MHWCSSSATLAHASSALLNKTHEKQPRRSICSQYIPSNTIPLKICTKSISHKSVTFELNTIWEGRDMYMSNIHLYWGKRAQHSWALISISRREAYSEPSWRTQTPWRSLAAFLLLMLQVFRCLHDVPVCLLQSRLQEDYCSVNSFQRFSALMLIPNITACLKDIASKIRDTRISPVLWYRK